MILRGTEDLRVQKTVAAIDQAFTAMLLESDYEDMSVKELCARAKINKKTFYRYYPTLQDLFREKLERLSTGYLERIAHYKLPEEFRHINREFFLFANEQGTVYEKIVCHPSYASFGSAMVYGLVRKSWEKSAFFTSLDWHRQNLMLCFLYNTGISLYQQWVKDGRALSLEEIIHLSETFLCHGMEGFVAGFGTADRHAAPKP